MPQRQQGQSLLVLVVLLGALLSALWWTTEAGSAVNEKQRLANAADAAALSAAVWRHSRPQPRWLRAPICWTSPTVPPKAHVSMPQRLSRPGSLRCAGVASCSLRPSSMSSQPCFRCARRLGSMKPAMPVRACRWSPKPMCSDLQRHWSLRVFERSGP